MKEDGTTEVKYYSAGRCDIIIESIPDLSREEKDAMLKELSGLPYFCPNDFQGFYLEGSVLERTAMLYLAIRATD